VRILLVHNRYRSGAPSGENRVVDQEAAALAARGHEVLTFGRSSDEIAQWPAWKKATLPGRTVWSPEAARDLSAALRARRPDVVHVHNTFPLLSPSVLHASRDAGVPVVATLHNYRLGCAGGTFFRDGQVCHDCVDGSPARAVVHGCYRGSRAATAPLALSVSLHRRSWRSLVSAYIFISAAQRDLLSGLGLPPDRSFVRWNLIPRLTMPRPTRQPTAVYAGRLDETKGVRVLMAGWDRYLAGASGTGLRLVIAGSGPLENEVARWASARPSVELTGALSGPQCAELIASARAVLLPSAWEEPFGLVAVEAMAAGVPPVASGHGAFTELITPGVDGALFRPGDPAALAAVIADVERDPARYERYGEQARRTYAERFDPDRSVEDLLGIYRYAVEHPVRSAVPDAA
jgi:glycosyltransferase involved in cell wall biosynthesis